MELQGNQYLNAADCETQALENQLVQKGTEISSVFRKIKGFHGFLDGREKIKTHCFKIISNKYLNFFLLV